MVKDQESVKAATSDDPPEWFVGGIVGALITAVIGGCIWLLCFAAWWDGLAIEVDVLTHPYDPQPYRYVVGRPLVAKMRVTVYCGTSTSMRVLEVPCEDNGKPTAAGIAMLTAAIEDMTPQPKP